MRDDRRGGIDEANRRVYDQCTLSDGGNECFAFEKAVAQILIYRLGHEMYQPFSLDTKKLSSLGDMATSTRIASTRRFTV